MILIAEQYFTFLRSPHVFIMPIVRLMLFVIPLTLGFTQSAPAARLPSASEHQVIVGGDHNYPPYEFLDTDNQPSGYNVELTRAIAEVMGMNVKIQLGSWDEMRAALKNGEIDALQGMVFSEERSRLFDFTQPHAVIHQSIFARTETPAISTIRELEGKQVIVQKGGIMHDYLIESGIDITLVLVDTHADALRLLAEGKHDYAMVANLPGLYLSRELGLSNIRVVAKPLDGRKYGYSVIKGNKELLAFFSEGLAILKKNGRHQQIYDKWLGVLEPHTTIPWRQIGMSLGIVALLLIVVLGGAMIWNRTLKREVALRTEEIEKQHQQLIQADKMVSLGFLVSGVAHEINNPIGLLLHNISTFKESYLSSQDILEQYYQGNGDFDLGGLSYTRMRDEIPLMFDEMIESSQRIKRIVEDLKTFARQQDRSDHNQSVDINTSIKAAVRLTDNSIRKATHHFREDYAESLPPVLGNSQRIEQIAINLILNACQALNGQNQEIKLVTSWDRKMNEVVFEVHDKGVGIDAKNMPHLMDPFFTTKREQGGTGLGLAITANIAHEHGGSLKLNSSPGKGTVAVVRLPAISS